MHEADLIYSQKEIAGNGVILPLVLESIRSDYFRLKREVAAGILSRMQAIDSLNALLGRSPVSQVTHGLYARALYPVTEGFLGDSMDLPKDEIEPLKASLPILAPHGDAVIIDYLAGPEMLRSLHDRGGLFAKGIAIGLSEDLRTVQERKSDEERGIYYIQEDITKPIVWKKLDSVLDVQKTTVQIMDGGTGFYEAFGGNTKLITTFLSNAFSRLSSNSRGSIDLSMPFAMRDSFQGKINTLAEKNNTTILRPISSQLSLLSGVMVFEKQ